MPVQSDKCGDHLLKQSAFNTGVNFGLIHKCASRHLSEMSEFELNESDLHIKHVSKDDKHSV